MDNINNILPIGKLQDASLIMWNECSMSHRAHVDDRNNKLRLAALVQLI